MDMVKMGPNLYHIVQGVCPICKKNIFGYDTAMTIPVNPEGDEKQKYHPSCVADLFPYNYRASKKSRS